MSKGVLYILIASFFFGVINVLVKYLQGIPAVEIVFFRSVVSLLISGYYVYRLKLDIFPPAKKILFARGLTGALALLLYFHSIHIMPLATAVTILYLAPIFTLIAAIFLLKEYPQKKQWPFICLCFLGVVLMKNHDERVPLLGMGMALLAAIFAGLAYNFIRMLKERVHHQLVIFYFPLITIPLCLPFLWGAWTTPTLTELILLLGIGLFTQLAQIYMTKAYMAEPAAKISHFNYLTSFYAWISGMIFFNEHLNWISLVGLLIVFVGIYFSTYFSKR